MTTQRTHSETSALLYTNSLQKAAAKELPIADLFTAARTLTTLGQAPLANELYKIWIAYHPDSSFLYAVYFNYGMSLVDTGDRYAAINALRQSLAINPDFHAAYINLGRVLEDTGQAGPAVTQWIDLVSRLSTITGDTVGVKLTALQQIGRVLRANNENLAAEDSLRQSLEIDPNQVEIIQHWIAVRQAQCKWPVISGWGKIRNEDLLAKIFPWSLANYSDDPMFQFATAFIHNKRAVGLARRTSGSAPEFSPQRRSAPRLRIGYVSSDLRDHAVGFGVSEVFELHDRREFEVFAYYCGIKHSDKTQERIKAGVDHWIDINDMSDEDAARRITDDKIDILIDLNGYTMNARTKVFAFKPAPIIVNWFGFPSTMGSPYHHYLVADPFIIPPRLERFYSEKVLRMPCYQPNDRKREIAASRPSRRDEGLPENAFVFCCLNGLQKLTARTFQRWLVILGQVPNSVLWLLGGAKETNDRLKLLASQNGIASERLIFAGRVSNPAHLARYPLADLFLDNLPYGAHTTAADALWMGVPVLTTPGRSFASRVCGSLVQAAGLDEMLCQTPNEYMAKAIELGRDPVKMAAVKAKLAKQRDTCLLFDSKRLVGNLEALFQGMWADFEAGRLPTPDLRNLEVYHEIGLELDHENIETLSDSEYEALYAAKLAIWNETYPVAPDQRLWHAAPGPVMA